MTTTEATDATPESEAPAPTFASMGVGEAVLKALSDMEWESPTPVQIESYPAATAGRDLIVQARTGTGKTGAFGIPLVDVIVDETPGVQALILAPTRELALQSCREIDKLAAHKKISGTAVYGGASIEKQIRELEEGAQIVSGTPGRVLDHLKRGTLDASGLKALVLDEADEMLSMGFAKELHAIMERLPKEKQTLLYSATVEGQVLRVAERHMTDPEYVTLSGDAVGALGVSHFVYMVSGMAREHDLIRILNVEDPESGIIFCNTKVETERVATALQNAGFSADWLNGDLAQNEREKVMGRCRDGSIRYLVCTDVAARGIDISHLTHVINYGLPPHIEQYVHRTGRTGRAGRTGVAVTLVSPQELGTLYYLRLQYKIFPVERSLPTKGEERTRLEADRVGILEAAFADPAQAIDISVARRLLTHPDVEHLLAGLLGTFFGKREGDVDEEAAETRRARSPEPAPPIEEEDEKPRPRKRVDRPKREDHSERPARKRRRSRRQEPGEEGESDAPRETAASDAPQETAASEAPRETAASDAPRKTSDSDAPRERADSDAPRGGSDDEDDEMEVVTLFLNVGRKDEVRAGDLNRLLQDEADVAADDIGRIRVRDKHSFVDIAPEALEGAIEKLTGKTMNDRELVAEKAKPRR